LAIVDGILQSRREEHLTFKANLRTTRYGWLRLTPAYSVHLVRELVEGNDGDREVLDPFCGTGTTALVCAERGLRATTTDINPFLVWLAGAKCASYSERHLAALTECATLVGAALTAAGNGPEWIPALHQIEKWWELDVLHALARAMAGIRALDGKQDREVADLLRIAFCRLMITTAHVTFGHQSMSFKKRVTEPGLFPSNPLEQLRQEWDRAVADLMLGASTPLSGVTPSVLLCDARKLGEQLDAERYDLVVTSPPYPNRMSYIRELRPYMYWLDYLQDGKQAGELDWKAIGGTWGIATSRLNDWSLGDALGDYPKIEETCSRIADRSDLLARYVQRYFADMKDHCRQLHAVVARGGRIHYVVGNSKFYDVILPVEQFFCELFVAAGFSEVKARPIRKRTSKRELFEYCVSAVKA
jgi:hypothetical protein